MKTLSKGLLLILVCLIIVLIIGRIYLPTYLKQYVEKRINNIPEYHVKIKDIDVHLIRGSYTIHDLSLYKIKEKIPVPFFAAQSINFSVQWKALLHGSIVAQIKADKPVLNFVIEPNGQNQQLSIDKEWEQVVQSLFPLNINKVLIHEGTISLHSFHGKPPFEQNLSHINFRLDNLQKVYGNEGLYSKFDGHGIMNQGKFSISGSVDPFAKQPTFILKNSLKSMKIKGANDFLLHFISLDVADGEFSLYSEFAAKKGKLTGYAKPLIKHLKILDLKEKKPNPIEFLYKGVMEVGAKIMTNPIKKTIATKIKISGDIENPKTSFLSIVGFLLRNAFIEALLPQLDHSIAMKDIHIDKNTKL
ncbi:MAG: DUF748 domain-containing protein [Legionella sp.]|nr:DUF748 domain-containing protein [Legionella sp.]